MDGQTNFAIHLRRRQFVDVTAFRELGWIKSIQLLWGVGFLRWGILHMFPVGVAIVLVNTSIGTNLGYFSDQLPAIQMIPFITVSAKISKLVLSASYRCSH
jgi:hypothetical protein